MFAYYELKRKCIEEMNKIDPTMDRAKYRREVLNCIWEYLGLPDHADVNKEFKKCLEKNRFYTS